MFPFVVQASTRARGVMAATAIGSLLMSTLAACGSSAAPPGTDSGASSSCQAPHKITTISPGKLTVVGTQFAPWYTASDGKAEGVESEMLQLVAAKECLTLVGNALDAPGVISSVTTGRADLAIGGWVRSEQRRTAVDMTDPIYVDPIAIISKDGLKSFDEVKSAGTTLGDIGGVYEIPDLKALLGDKLKLYQTFDQALKDLSAGRISAVTMPLSSAQPALDKLKITGFQVVKAEPTASVQATQKPAQIGWLLKRGNSGLETALNADLAELRTSGELKTILAKHQLPELLLETGEPYFS